MKRHSFLIPCAVSLTVPRRKWLAAFGFLLFSLAAQAAFGQCTTNGVASPCTLTGPVSISTYNAPTSTETNASGVITASGAVVFTGGSGGNNVLNLTGNTTLAGGGTYTLQSSGGAGNQYVQQGVAGLTLTNQSTLQGTGDVGNGGLTFVNAGSGVVNANASGLTLLFDNTGGITNQGLMEATGGGILQISSNVINNGANITADGGSVVIQSSSVQGGSLTTKNGGTLSTLGSSFLDGTVGAAGITISSGTTYLTDVGNTTAIAGTLTNNGTLVVNGGSGGNGVLGLNASTTLTGGGTLTLGYSSGAGSAYVQQNVGGLTLTNVNNLIQGAGTIGNGALTFINNATVNANSSGNTLLLNAGGGVTNTSLLEATNGGTLQINSNVINNGANITANGGSVVIQNSAVQGGTLTAKNGGAMSTQGSSFLDGTVGAAGITLASGTTYLNDVGNTTSIAGTLTNNGSVLVNGGGGGNGILQLNTSTTLTGGGTVTLGYTGSGAGQAYIQQSVGGLTLTNVNNLIQGAGTIGNNGLAFINNATVNANSNGNVLLLNSANLTNTSLLEATNGGILNITGVNLQNAGANITATGSSAINFSNSTILGGTISGANLTSVSSTFDGSTASGAINLKSGSTLATAAGNVTYLAGTINNQGTLTLAGGNGSDGILETVVGAGNSSTTTLTGGGTITMNYSGGAGQPYIQQQVGGMTLINTNNLIQGAGTIGNNGLAFINNATVNANSNGNVLLLNSANLTNTSLLEATNGGILDITGVTLQNQGANITASASSAINFSSSTILGGTISGANMTSVSSTFDGSTASGTVTFASGSTLATAAGNVNYLAGTINNQGTLTLGGGNGQNGELETVLGAGGSTTTTLSGGGTITLTTLAGAGAAYIEQSVGGMTLNNVNNTIQGSGIIGNNGLVFVNGAAGTVLANAGTLLLNGGGNVTNNGLFQANAGSTLQVTSPLTNFSGSTLTGGTYSVFGTAANPGTIQVNAFGTTGGEVLTNAASIYLQGVNSTIVDQNGNDALSNLTNNGAAGQLSILSGRAFNTNAGTFTNAGSVTVGTGSAFTVNTGAGTYTQTGGTTHVDGSLTAATTNINGGVLMGTGTVNGLVTNAGTIKPGETAPGTLTINGNYVQTTAGALDIALAGTTSGQFDTLQINGLATLAGAIDFSAINGLGLSAGETFDILNFTAGDGGTTFSTDDFTDLNLGPGLTASLVYNTNDVLLEINGTTSASPEPGTWMLLTVGLGMMGAGVVRRRRK